MRFASVPSAAAFWLATTNVREPAATRRGFALRA